MSGQEDANAIEGLGRSLSNAILVNTRGRMIQQQIAQRGQEDFQNALLRKAQTLKAEQEVADMVEANRRAKAAGAAMFDIMGGRNVLGNKQGPSLQNATTLNQAMAGREFASSAAMNPAASASMFEPKNVTRGSIGVDALGRRTDNRIPVNVSLNSIAYDPDTFLPVARGNVGSAGGGIRSPEGQELVPPAPRTPQGDVERLRMLKAASEVSAKDLILMEDTDPEQAKLIRQLAKEYWSMEKQRASGGAGAGAGVSSGTTAPLVVTKMEEVK